MTTILCDDVLGIIFQYLRPREKVFLNHLFYKTFHDDINIPRYDSFIRNIIRKDYEFVLRGHLLQKYDGWWKLKNWVYKNATFYNYIEYLSHISHNSPKCRLLIEDTKTQKQSYAKKKYKKARIRYSGKWSN